MQSRHALKWEDKRHWVTMKSVCALFQGGQIILVTSQDFDWHTLNAFDVFVVYYYLRYLLQIGCNPGTENISCHEIFLPQLVDVKKYIRSEVHLKTISRIIEGGWNHSLRIIDTFIEFYELITNFIDSLVINQLNKKYFVQKLNTKQQVTSLDF